MTSRSVLITGSCGYLGSRLLHDFSNADDMRDVSIRALDNMQRGNYSALFGLGGNQCEFIEADILDPASLRFAMSGVDTVIHLAGIVTTPVTFAHDRFMEQINHWGTANLMTAAIETGVRRVIYASSHAVYGDGGPHSEAAPCRPVGTYGMSVRNAELAILASAERGPAANILRFGSLFGYSPVSRIDNVANRFAMLAALGKSLAVFGDGHQRRPLISVDDASSAIRFVLLNEASVPSIVNVCDGNPSVLELAQMVRNIRPDCSLRYTEQDVLTHLSFELESHYLEDAGWTATVGLQRALSHLIERFGSVRATQPARPV